LVGSAHGHGPTAAPFAQGLQTRAVELELGNRIGTL
jgi:hypothetical protein